MNATNKRIQPYQIAQTLRAKGVTVTAQEIAAYAVDNKMGRYIRQTGLGLVLNYKQANAIIHTFSN